MKIISIILSMTLIFGLCTVNSFAYTRPENIVSEFNDFENGVGDWTNGSISGVVNDNGNLTTNATSLTITSDGSGTHGNYLVAVSTANNERECPTFLFDEVNAKKTTGSASSSAKVKNGTLYGFEFDFRIPTSNNSSTAIEIKTWDTARNRNRGTIFKITPNSGKVENNNNNHICTLAKNTWYKIKIESVAGSNKHRIIIMDDSGKEIANGRYNTAIASQNFVTFITFSKGGTNCEMHFDNTRLYTFSEADLNADRVLFTDKTLRTLNLGSQSFEVEANNKFTSFDTTEVPSKVFVAETKLRTDDTTKDNDIKISLKEAAVATLLTTISPHSGKVELGSVSSGATVGGLSMDSGTWYDVRIIYNSDTDYQRVEITNSSTNETQVFSGLSGYLPADISAFSGVLFETTCTEDVVTEFDGLNIHTASKQYAADFYTMDSYEIDKNASEIVVKTSAGLTGVSDETVTLKDGDGEVVNASVSYNANTITITPSKTFKENERMQLIFSKEILVGGEKPRFDSVINFKVLMDEINMDYTFMADGVEVTKASDLKGKSNISCNISSSLRTGTTSFNGMYVITIMDKNNEIKAISADDISLSEEATTSDTVSLNLSVPDGGEDLEIYIMLIDNFQSSKALAKYIKIY